MCSVTICKPSYICFFQIWFRIQSIIKDHTPYCIPHSTANSTSKTYETVIFSSWIYHACNVVSVTDVSSHSKHSIRSCIKGRRSARNSWTLAPQRQFPHWRSWKYSTINLLMIIRPYNQVNQLIYLAWKP